MNCVEYAADRACPQLTDVIGHFPTEMKFCSTSCGIDNKSRAAILSRHEPTMHLLTDPLTAITIFVLGASAGSLLTFIQDRAIINRYKQEPEKASLLSDIGEKAT